MKNMKNKIIVIITFLAGLFLLNSCLKDNADYWKADVAGKMYATVLNPSLQSLALKPTTDTVTFSFMLNIASDQLPTSDVTITVAADPAAVTAFNTRTGKSYLSFPTFEVLTPTVTIAAGTRTAMINGRLWGADKLNACDNFIAAISIISVSDANIPIASNMKSYLLSLPISNPYEGSYHSTGVFHHPLNGDRVINEDKILKTVDCKSVSTTVGDLATGEVIFTVNLDNSVTISGAGISLAQPSIQGPGTNTYNPLTHTFTVDYYYVGSGGNRSMQETIVRN
jgi:Domain of unknown function (DUF4361)/Domain of unknown function (DUF1735)